MLVMLPEKLLIWTEIKNATPAIMKAGGNAVEILIWSQDKTLKEVREVLRGPDTVELFEKMKARVTAAQNEQNMKKISMSSEMDNMDTMNVLKAAVKTVNKVKLL